MILTAGRSALMIPKILTRQHAIARGHKRYFTGIPCKYGHVSERFVSNRKCIACHRLVPDLRQNHRRKGETMARGRPAISWGHWPAAEALIERNHNGEPWCAIAASLGVARRTVRRYLNTNGFPTIPVAPKKPTAPERRAKDEARLPAIKSDRAFLAAIRAAISLGAECAVEGIKVDLTPIPATRFQAPELPHSGCGSPSAMCLE